MLVYKTPEHIPVEGLVTIPDAADALRRPRFLAEMVLPVEIFNALVQVIIENETHVKVGEQQGITPPFQEQGQVGCIRQGEEKAGNGKGDFVYLDGDGLAPVGELITFITVVVSVGLLGKHIFQHLGQDFVPAEAHGIGQTAVFCPKIHPEILHHEGSHVKVAIDFFQVYNVFVFLGDKPTNRPTE